MSKHEARGVSKEIREKKAQIKSLEEAVGVLGEQRRHLLNSDWKHMKGVLTRRVKKLEKMMASDDFEPTSAILNPYRVKGAWDDWMLPVGDILEKSRAHLREVEAKIEVEKMLGAQ